MGFMKLRTVNCKRCGEPIITIDNPPEELAETYAKWGGICQSCMAPGEYKEMDKDATAELKKHGVELPKRSEN